MSDRWLRLYRILPSPARSVAVSMRGYQLRSWRYGPETDRLVAEALERETWSAERWKAWQEERLAYVLHRAATRVPYYREQWSARRRRGDRASWERLENWPILEKETLRQSPMAFVADDCDVRRMSHEHTSGTTGKALDLWRSRDTVRAWYALTEARARVWYGVSRNDRWAILGGRVLVPVYRREPPFWVWNAPLNQLYLSTYHLAADLIPHYFSALRNRRIRYLWGYSSSLYALAREALRLQRQDLKMQVVITNAEPLFPKQRSAIAKAFQCPVRETYGMVELTVAASECSEERLHLWPEVGWVERMDADPPAADRSSGELVCTGLLNADMPFIRYRTGDRASFDGPIECGCGRRLPVLASLEGRVADEIWTADGRRFGFFDIIFEPEMHLREAQIVQESLNRIRIRYVPAPEFNSQAADRMIDSLRERMSNVEVILEEVEAIPRGPNGKFPVVVCNLPPGQRPFSTPIGKRAVP